MTHPPVCLISQQPDTREQGEMERGQSRPQGTFKMPLWADVRQQLLCAKLTKPERNTCCLGERGLIQEMALLAPSPPYPLTREGINSESAATRKNGGSEGHWGQTGHLAKTHHGRYCSDVIAAFLWQNGATSGMFDLDRGGPLVFRASQIKRNFQNIQAAGVTLVESCCSTGSRTTSRANTGSWLKPSYSECVYFDSTSGKQSTLTPLNPS